MSNGVDLVLISRFESIKNNKRFLDNNFLESEITYMEKCSWNAATAAGIFAAKEAFLKAIKKGINNYSLKDIEVLHNDDGAPYIVLHSELLQLVDSNNICLSISHDGDYAIAFVLLSLYN